MSEFHLGTPRNLSADYHARYGDGGIDQRGENRHTQRRSLSEIRPRFVAGAMSGVGYMRLISTGGIRISEIRELRMEFSWNIGR